MERKIIFKTATVAAALVAVMSATVYAQEKYALISPGGIAFSDFKGYGTLVGERGIKLSGGERQRVALARAFLADAPILILDEATSSLDSESEALIQDATERLMQGPTTIVIAHRLSTVRALKRILIFDRGRIIEEGDHGALISREKGVYRRLFDRQVGGLLVEMG